MKFLLGATAALLLGAIVVSWQGMKRGVDNAPPDELAQLKKQIAELQQERGQAGQGTTQGEPQPQGADLDPEDYKRQLAELQRKLAEAEAAKTTQNSQLDAQLQRDEEGLIAQKLLESKDAELRRARLISQALLVGTVTEYAEDPQYGGFITFDVKMPDQVQVGSIIGIRRNTGILYQFKVSDVTPQGAIANPLTVIGPIKPMPGDELIFPPLY